MASYDTGNFKLPNNAAQQHDFAKIPGGKIPRSLMNRNCGHKTTCDMGDIVPVFLDEAVPGDTMTLKPTIAARINTQLKPVMDSMFIDLHFFAVPHRIVWENWERFCGAQDDPGDSTDYEVPVCATGVVAEGGTYDHMGIPPTVDHDTHGGFTNLWGRAFNLIWNEWYRDENLQDQRTVPLGDGPDTVTDFDTLPKRGKRHDYFTSCMPSPQKGPAVLLPIGGQAPLEAVIETNGDTLQWTQKKPGFADIDFNLTGEDVADLPSGNVRVIGGSAALNDGGTMEWKTPGLQLTSTSYADLSSATAISINEMRNAIAIQRVYEKDMRGGTRYRELLMSHYGTTINDGRVQVPQFLGGTTARVNIQGVVQTSGFGEMNSEARYMGDLAGMSYVVDQGRGFTKNFDEHCMIIGLMSGRTDLNYQQGLQRHFSRRDRFDFYWPEFADIGEQATLNKEIYISENTTIDNAVFGYQERYAEYRYTPSLITGKFRSSDPQSLDIWHLAQDFATLPTLGNDFIEENPPMARIVAAVNEPDILADLFFEYKCARPMPLYGVPGLKRL